MTSLYHTPIVTGSPVNTSVVNSPLSELDAAIAALLTGGQSFTKMNLGTETELTIGSGVITVTQLRHQVDTESDAAADEVTDILGGVAGQILFLRSVVDTRVPTIKHNAAKIFLGSRQDVALDNPLMGIALLCVNGTIWMQIDPSLALKVSAQNSLKYPRDLAVVPSLAARNRIWAKASAATFAAVGCVVTNGAALTAGNDTDSAYINVQATAGAGNPNYIETSTFNYFRRSHNPKFETIIRTGLAADLANMRFWIGITSATPTNVDSLVGVASFAGFRYSSAVDSGFVPVCCDNAAQNVGSPMAAIVASTRYLLSLEVNDANGTVTFRINNGTPTVLNTNLPAAATELGFSVKIITTVAVVKNFKFSRAAVDFD